MAQSAVIQAVVTPTRWFATLVAAILLGVFLLACVLLYVHADDAPEPLWTHWIKIFEALGPLVGLAVGWVFGKEVHRREADAAKQTAKEFAQGAHDGHALAEAVSVSTETPGGVTGLTLNVAVTPAGSPIADSVTGV